MHCWVSPAARDFRRCRAQLDDGRTSGEIAASCLSGFARSALTLGLCFEEGDASQEDSNVSTYSPGRTHLPSRLGSYAGEH